jgi:Glycosyltransferase (GlcNAc)
MLSRALFRYDVYTPTRNVVFHDYVANPTIENSYEWYKPRRERFRKAAITRVKQMLHMPTPESSTVLVNLSNLGIYGLGKRRSLAQLEEFAQVNLKLGRAVAAGNCANLDYVPYDASISPIQNLFAAPDDLDPQPEFPLRTNLIYPYDETVVMPRTTSVVPGLKAHDIVLLDNKKQSFAGVSTTTATEPYTPSSPLLVIVLWIVGLIIWCAVFGRPCFANGSRPPKPTRDVSKSV